MKESFGTVNKFVEIEEAQSYDSRSRKTVRVLEVRVKSDADSGSTSVFVLDRFAAFELYRDLKAYLDI